MADRERHANPKTNLGAKRSRLATSHARRSRRGRSCARIGHAAGAFGAVTHGRGPPAGARAAELSQIPSSNPCSRIKKGRLSKKGAPVDEAAAEVAGSVLAALRLDD